MEKGLDEGCVTCVLVDERKILNLGRKYIRNRNVVVTAKSYLLSLASPESRVIDSERILWCTIFRKNNRRCALTKTKAL